MALRIRAGLVASVVVLLAAFVVSDARSAAEGEALGTVEPRRYQRLLWSSTAAGLPYLAAASTCPGLPPSVLSAIHEVETRSSTASMVSSAGAVGPMQFLPSTWAAYGTDGNGDGHADIHDPVDALYTASRYLCANGGGDPATLRSAIWNYNHSWAYVDQVLSLAGTLSTV